MPRCDRSSPSPHEHGERAGERGAFHLTQHQSPFAPSAREAGVLFRMSRVNREAICIEGGAKHGTIPHRHSRAGGNPVLFFPCHPERSEGSGLATLKPWRTRLRAPIGTRAESLGSAPQGRVSFLCLAKEKIRKERRPDVRAHQSPMLIDGSPALLGQGGRFRQAIPGLSENASASCLARVCARLFHLGLRCSAQPDGKVRQKPNQKLRQKRRAPLAFSPLSPCGRGLGRGVRSGVQRLALDSLSRG